ncbi:hypothetical protein FB645_001690 [Coemansia sp. IMI 203386]|nr:hypothetical protein FB645_001690 [Coemansia sp. IMI 203386]
MTSAPTPETPSPSTTRILFRVSDGRTNIQSFPTSTTLADIRQYIHKQLDLDPSTTEISKRMPAKTLDVDIDKNTLEDLDLVPTGTLLLCSLVQRQKELKESEEQRKREYEEKGEFLQEDSWHYVSHKAYLYTYAAVIVGLVAALLLFLTRSQNDQHNNKY